jgi:uncharacterized membrane protein YhaH (DUF805 family)
MREIGAGWARDPTGRNELRWWDGARWTDKVADDGVAAFDPLGIALGRSGLPARDSGTNQDCDSSFRADPFRAASRSHDGPSPSAGSRLRSGPSRGPFVAVRRCLDKTGDFEGRASRAEYWWFQLFCTIAVLTSGLLTAILPEELGWIFFALVWVLLAVSLLSASARRLHDSGRAAWWLLLHIAAPLGWIALAVFLVSPGDPERNTFGAPVG